MIYPIIQIVLGIVGLVLAADQLVLAARRMANYWKVPGWIIGITVVAFGTSLPEFVVNLVSMINGHPDLAVGTVIGSNIVNVLLIIGVLICIRPTVLSIQRNSELWFMVGVGCIAAVLLLHESQLSRLDSIILLGLLSVYSLYLFWFNVPAVEEESNAIPVKLWGSVLRLGLSVAVLGFAGNLTTDASVVLATQLGLSQSIISLTILAWGTSLPELVTSSMAAWRNQPGLALGNIVGSYTLNIIVIFGVVGLIQPIPYSSTFNVELSVMLLASGWLIAALFLKKYTPLGRSLAVVFLGLFALYCIFLLR